MPIRTLFFAVAAALLLSGCAQIFGDSATPPSAPESGESPTIRIHNQGLSTLAVYEQGRSNRIGTVMPGQSECMELTIRSEQMRLIARPVGGGDPTVSPVFDAERSGGWSWSLANTPNLDRLSLEPAEPCA